MRITFVVPGRGLSGGLRVIATYARGLIERGHDVRLVCSRPPTILRPKALFWRTYRGLRRTIGLDRDHLDTVPGQVRSISTDRLADAIPDGDVVLATHWLTADPVAALPSSKGQKFYFIQGYEVYHFDPVKVDATWRLPLRKIVIARWLLDLAREKFGDRQVALIPNGVETDLFDAPPRDRHDPPCVGFVHSNKSWKGAAVAAEAIRQAGSRIRGLRAVSFGEQPPTALTPLPPDTQYHLRPAQEKLRHIYAAADVWLCASETEGFSLPPLEAMACRCPVVCTRCGGPEDFVENGVNGFLVDVGDATGMAERILATISNAQQWRTMSEAAYAASRRFNWDASIGLMERTLAGDTNVN